MLFIYKWQDTLSFPRFPRMNSRYYFVHRENLERQICRRGESHDPCTRDSALYAYTSYNNKKESCREMTCLECAPDRKCWEKHAFLHHQSILGSFRVKARKLPGSLIIPMLPHFTGSASFGSLAFTKGITRKRHLSAQLPQRCTEGKKGKEGMQLSAKIKERNSKRYLRSVHDYDESTLNLLILYATMQRQELKKENIEGLAQ